MDKLEIRFDKNANELEPAIFKKEKGVVKHLQGSHHHHHLLNIFPAEVWIIILEKLENASDLENVSRASSFFSDLLASKAALFLFPNVFKVMTSHWTRNSRDISELTGNCRLVCSFWNRAIQDFYESHNAHNVEETGTTPVVTAANVTFPLVSDCGLTKFISHFDRTHYSVLPSTKNPFLGRAVVFNDTKFQPGLNATGPHYLHEFWLDISNLLVKYGSHIWYCTIQLEDKFSTVEEYYFKLWEWLDLMRNLKGLRVVYYKNRRRKELPDVLLEERIRDCPMPKLRTLEVLTTIKLPSPIANALLRCNDNVKIITVNGNKCS